jgi:hypothetical protein
MNLTVLTFGVVASLLSWFLGEERKKARARVGEFCMKLFVIVVLLVFWGPKPTIKLAFLSQWLRDLLPEEYCRHLLDCRKHWLRQKCSPIYIQIKTAGFLLAIVWAVVITQLERSVSRNHIT